MYLVIEIQTYQDGTVGNIVTQHGDFNEAQSKYHAVLSAAAVSQIPCHAAVIMSNEGVVYEDRFFKHGSEE